MKLQNVNFNKIENVQNNNIRSASVNSAPASRPSYDLKSYPANYYISFGARSIKEVYEEHAETEMPRTVKCFIDDLSVTTSKEKFDRLMAQPRLYQIQKQAFADLEHCKTVEDIKKAYPAEEYFRNLVSATDLSPRANGLFTFISQKLNKGVKVFDFEEDLTTYIVKQLFYEGVSLTDIQKNVASATLDKEVKERIENYKTWHVGTFTSLGINAPNGTKYGSAILYSEDRKYSRALSEALKESWASLSPEEVTKRIEQLLQGGKKERLTMIDAWNKCVSLRNELSNFLFENLDNDKYTSQKANVNIMDSIYDGNFSIKMRKLMTDFWELHPNEKIELSVEIRKSRKTYEEKMAQGPEVFAQYEKDIIEEKNVISQKLKDERLRSRKYDMAKQLIYKIAQKSKQMYIKTPETVNDLYNILLQHVTNKQLKIYEQRLVVGDNEDEFKKVYPPHNEIDKAKRSLEYTNLMYSQIATILTPELRRGKISEEVIISALQDKQKFDTLIRNCAQNRTSTELNEYSRMKKFLSQGEKEQIKNVLVQYLPQDEETMLALDKYLNTQGKYLMQITSENQSVRNTFIMMALQKFGEMTNAQYVQGFIEQVQDERKQQNKLNALDNINWSEFSALSWDI